MESKVSGLQKELSETKEVKSQSNRKWSRNESSLA